MRVLIIEDDTDIATNLYDYLAANGHVVDAAANGVMGLHLALTHVYDAILLDLSLPGLDGMAICRKLREEAHCETPILMLTARDTLEAKLEGFAQGADDYLVKPFALKEVEARLLALNKRHTRSMTSHVLQVGDLMFDPQRMLVERAGVPIKLPPKCLRILEVLAQHPHKVFSRKELETAVWGEEQTNSDSLRSHIHILRRALAQPGLPALVETVHGMGFRLVPADAR